MRVGNGVRVAALSIETYILTLPSGLILSLEDCYYVPALTKNIVSISSLNNKGFLIGANACIKNNTPMCACAHIALSNIV